MIGRRPDLDLQKIWQALRSLARPNLFLPLYGTCTTHARWAIQTCVLKKLFSFYFDSPWTDARHLYYIHTSMWDNSDKSLNFLSTTTHRKFKS
ncbi:hypothetical protein MtrunA17_Chr3g0110711 [Medicago truncatula]|nr:hypothetical protein MtrunA17_Chr3g0110711 [Medicago truncatula]